MCNTRDRWSWWSPASRYRGEMLFDGISHQVPDTDPGETRGVARLVRRRRRRPGPRPGALPAHEAPGAGPHQAGRVPRHGLDAVREHHPGRRRALVPRRRVPGAPHPRLHPLERRGHGHPGQHAHRGHRRAPVDLCQLGRALRGRLQPLLPRQGGRRLRRPGVLPGARVARHLRPGLRRGPADREGARQLPPRGGGRRPAQLSPPALAARLLGVPHGVDGAGADRRHLPGPRQPLPQPAPPGRHQRAAGSGASSATGRWTSPSPSAPWAWPAGSTSTT